MLGLFCLKGGHRGLPYKSIHYSVLLALSILTDSCQDEKEMERFRGNESLDKTPAEGRLILSLIWGDYR